jgi:hypothetical protein
VFFPRRPGQSESDFLAALLAPVYGVSPQQMEAGLKGADRFDLLEMIMDLDNLHRSPTREQR